MMDTYFAGGYFMHLITICALASLVIAGMKTYNLATGNVAPTSDKARGLHAILFFGSLAFALGVLAHSVGLYQAMSVIEQMGGVSPALVAGGLKVALIPPIYGLLVLILSAIAWFFLRKAFKKSAAVSD